MSSVKLTHAFYFSPKGALYPWQLEKALFVLLHDTKLLYYLKRAWLGLLHT